MKEIGGYFGLESLINREYYPNLVALNSARNALLYILKAREAKRVYIPYFLCSSVADMLTREGYAFEYYLVDKNFLPIFDSSLSAGEYLYIVNYYGQLDDSCVKGLKAKYKNVILDNVQAFFSRPVDDIDTVYSCRKFFGVPDGAYAATTVILNEDLDLDISKDRMKHILGRFEGTSASLYYTDFKANDEAFRSMPLRRMSVLTHNILGAVDYEAVKKRREKNFATLAERLSEFNGLNIKLPEGPYAYPFYCKDGMRIKKKLAEKKIFVATLWPNVLELAGGIEKDYAENILPLPCDQRYDEKDMMYVAEEIIKCMKI